MASFSASNDGPLLLTIAQRQIETPYHLAVECSRNVAATRRRLAILKAMGLVEIHTPSLRAGRGRPETLVSLTDNGVQCLKALGLVDADTPPERLTAKLLKCVSHQEVVNEVRVQLTLVNRHLDGFSAAYHTPTPSLEPRTRYDAACCEDRELIPDGAFALTHAGTGKTLLFFLEVDMGTQPLISNRAGNRDVRSKLTRYQAMLNDGGYRRYESALGGGPFKGFRVLFVAEGLSRLAALFRLIHASSPSGFVLATDVARVRSRGIWAPIWTAGGDAKASIESILGSVAPERPPRPRDLNRRRSASGGVSSSSQNGRA